MSSGDDRLSRLLALVPWLSARPGVRVADAAAHFGVSEAQLRRDLELLFVCGLPPYGYLELIDIDFEGDTVTVNEAQGLDRPLRLTGSEALALRVAARALADVPGLDRNDALERALAILEKATGDAEGSPVTLDLAGVRVDEEVLATVREALDRQRRLHLRYLNEARDEVTERDVDPLTLHLRDGRFYLEGWCYRAEAMRLFRLDRVETVHVLDTPVDPPAQAQTLDLTAGTFTPSPEDFLVELELAPAGRWVVDYYPVEDVAEAPDGTLRVRLRSSSAGFARRLALRLGTEARVLSPAWLVSDVRKSAGQALAAYRPPSE